MWIVHRLLGSRYNEFLDYWCQSSGMNSVKANVLVFQVCAALCFGLIFFGLRAHVQLTNDALVVNGIFSPSEVRYPLADVQNIETSGRFVAPNGKSHNAAGICGDFQRWATLVDHVHSVRSGYRGEAEAHADDR